MGPPGSPPAPRHPPRAAALLCDAREATRRWPVVVEAMLSLSLSSREPERGVQWHRRGAEGGEGAVAQAWYRSIEGYSTFA